MQGSEVIRNQLKEAVHWRAAGERRQFLNKNTNFPLEQKINKTNPHICYHYSPIQLVKKLDHNIILMMFFLSDIFQHCSIKKKIGAPLEFALLFNLCQSTHHQHHYCTLQNFHELMFFIIHLLEILHHLHNSRGSFPSSYLSMINEAFYSVTDLHTVMTE